MSVVIEYTQSSHTVGPEMLSHVDASLRIHFQALNVYYSIYINKNDIFVESRITRYTLNTKSVKEKTDFIVYVEIEETDPYEKFQYKLFGPSLGKRDHFDSMNHVGMLPLA
ncbi:MAG: hypothetical protein JZD41_07580 [Thermoproteus sp.]|nr:hypothetical protein [Thermoproteus sp.]